MESTETVVTTRYLDRPTGRRPAYYPDPAIHKPVKRYTIRTCIDCGQEFERPGGWRKTVKCPDCGNPLVRHTDRIELKEVINIASAPSPKPTKLQGFIYLILIEIEQFKFFKIGRTRNPIQRSSYFEVKLPFDFEIIHLFPADDMYQAERKLHNHFADQRGNGEWFKLDSDDVSFIQAIIEYVNGDFV